MPKFVGADNKSKIRFPVVAKLYCKACNKLFRTSVFDEIHMGLPYPWASVTIKLDELKKETSKEIQDVDGNSVGIISLKGFELSVTCSICHTTNNYKIKDLIY